MSLNVKANQILNRSRELAQTAKSWADFSNALADQQDGLVAKAFPDAMERQAFYDSPQYKEINELLLGVIKRTGVIAGAAPTKSGRILLRLPKTVHSTLEVEAKKEGISLNQLAVAKLSLPLREATQLNTKLLVAAFADVHRGYSSDRVVVDPEFNEKFLRRCRELGLEQSEYALNHALFGIRKHGKAQLPPTTMETEYRDHDLYQFGSEIAVRILQRTEGVSLDRILCDPSLARKFDQLCRPLVDEKSILKLRWSALNLRKTRKLTPQDVHGTLYELQSVGPVRAISVADVPVKQATYAFYDGNRPIFAGETENLRKRIELHLEPGRLPDWINVRDPEFTLRYFVATTAHQSERLRWLRQFVNQERPVLNYQQAA